MMTAAPLVSILVISMNHARYISYCIESILEQDYPNFEVLYLDNASHDSTYEKGMLLLNDSPRLTYHKKQTESAGICRNLNHLLAQAKGKYCTFISADDFMLPGRIKNQVEEIIKPTEHYGVVYSDALLVDDENNFLQQTFMQKLGREISNSSSVYHDLLEGNFIPAMSTLVERSLIGRVGGFDESLIYEDHDMWLKLSQECKFFLMDKPQVVYRITPNSLEKKMGEKGLTDKIDIYYRQLGNNEFRPLVLGKIGAYTNHLYNYDYSAFKDYAKKYLALQFNLKTVIFLSLSYLGIPLFKTKK